MKKTYARLETGDRIRQRRLMLGLTQDEMAEKIDRASKYYADIERGSCGMSVETLMALSETLNLSMDYIIYGASKSETETNQSQITAILDTLQTFPEHKQQYALKMLQLFLAACDKE
ncbi:MAG: helix-turn-helix transcriptional regulator [Lachnospiraceae bacterium]|nr:helix-turn-helix transcriptional regulator [Lachnospiraceae bacterium]